MRDSRGIRMVDVAGLLKLEKYELPYPTKMDVRFANGFSVCHSDTYYWIIKGVFPLHIAREIQKKAEELSIRIHGGHWDWEIDKFLTHKNIESFQREYLQREVSLNLNEFTKECERIREDCIKNDYENCYIKYYHIDTLEGLRYVLDIIRQNNIYTNWFE